jgi:hypothetical protein
MALLLYHHGLGSFDGVGQSEIPNVGIGLVSDVSFLAVHFNDVLPSTAGIPRSAPPEHNLKLT